MLFPLNSEKYSLTTHDMKMACILDPANDVIYIIYIYGYIERYCLKHQIMSDPMLRRVVFFRCTRTSRTGRLNLEISHSFF